MWTLIGFNENASAASAYVNLHAAYDQTVHVVDDVLYVPDPFINLVACCAVGKDIVRAKLESPSLRRIGVMMIEPKSNYDYAAFRQYPVVRDSRESPIALHAGEGLEGFVYTGRAPDEFAAIGVYLSDGPITPVRGEIYTVRATFASLTPEEYKWINGELTFEETLPVGRYQVVGASCWHYKGLLFRLVPVGAPNRPGGICGIEEGNIEPAIQRMGEMGVWCEFHSLNPPSLDILAESVTASTGSVELDLIPMF